MPFQLLHEQWASYSAFYKYQPIGLVRYVNKYFLAMNVFKNINIHASLEGATEHSILNKSGCGLDSTSPIPSTSTTHSCVCKATQSPKCEHFQ